MDEYTADAFANRDEPIPLLTVTGSDDGSASEAEKSGKRERLRKSASRIKAMAQELGAEQAQRTQNSGTPSIQDRLFAKYLLLAPHTRRMNLTPSADSWNKSYHPKTSTVAQRCLSTAGLPNMSKDRLSVYR